MLHQRSTIRNWQELELKAILSGESVMVGNKYVHLKKSNKLRKISINLPSPGN